MNEMQADLLYMVLCMLDMVLEWSIILAAQWLSDGVTMTMMMADDDDDDADK